MDILKKATVEKRNHDTKPFTDVLDECDLVALYFSAHWCPPCKKFTPVLSETYKQLKSQGKKFEVVFVSKDNSEDSMFNYMAESHGDWYTIKYNDKARSELENHFKIEGIPTLVVLKKDGVVISKEARSEVQAKGAGAWDVWTAPTK